MMRPGASGLLLLALLAAHPVSAREQSLPCLYVARPTREDPTPQLGSHGDCATVQGDGSPRIRARHLGRIDFAGGPAAVLVADRWYYVTRDGRSARVLPFDDGADPFREGLARTVHAGKIGFIDETLRVVIPPQYDFAWPFENGSALVCTECRRGRPDADGHTPVTGGRWGYIDAAGRVVLPLRFEREEALSRRPAAR